ncbi:MAG: alpha/beta hydrolase-fold protein [Bacteroidales bacterium]|jgi:enterochelin esterase family protein|nr:alpha/beta hydrolase-fold protein [Bacteroidales bacterium]
MKTGNDIKIVAVIVLALIILSTDNSYSQAQPAIPARRASAAPVRVNSPEILPDNKVILRVYSKEAAQVSVTGEWQSGQGAQENLARNDSGMFSITIGPLAPELYAYTFTVDGVRALDPGNVNVRRDGVRYENFFIIPGPGSDLYIHRQNIPHGTVSKMWYHSETLSKDRRLYVYTPAGYEAGNEAYPVFYLLHGAGGDEDAWTNMGRAAQIMDNLIARGEAKPMIVVMTNGNPGESGAQNEIPRIRTDPQSGQSATGNFEESLVKDVMPFIEKTFRTIPGKDNRAIAGLSMGGAHTQTITNNNPGMFGYIGVFSMGLMNMGPRTVDAATEATERDEKIEALKKSGYKLYWIACGKDDFVYQSAVNLRNLLDKHEFRYIYRESTGGHTWANWRIYLSEFAPMLFK